MKKLFALIGLCACLSAMAQQKQAVSDNYKRNSLSLIMAEHGATYESQLYDYTQSIKTGDKFDINDIATKKIKITGNQTVNHAVAEAGLGREIISFWYKRQADGKMDDGLVLERGRYNATDQDVLNASATMIGNALLEGVGHTLINGSYVMVLDYSNIKTAKNQFNQESWYVTTTAHVFKVDYTDAEQKAVFDTWIYPEDNAQKQAEKNAAFNSIAIKMAHKGSASYESNATTDNGGLKAAVQSGYENVLAKLEKQIGEWQVTTSVAAVKPLSAKIGSKEGLKNGNRYQVYKFAEDANGNLKSISKGYIRATEISNNSGMATGATKPSKFYQISGGSLKEGMLMKQSNDLGMAVGLGFKAGGLSPYNLTIDYLAHIGTGGNSMYGMFGAGYDLLSGSKIHDKFDNVPEILDGGISFINASIGFGYGVRPHRYLELVPFIMGGGDYMMLNLDADSSLDEEDDEFMQKVAWFGNAGLRANINVKYPLQVFAQLDYTFFVLEGDFYKTVNDVLEEADLHHKGGVGFMVGVKWTF